jgi:hypothetical protein
MKTTWISQVIGGFAAGAIVSGALVASAMNRPPPNDAAALKPARAAAAASSIPMGQSRLDLLRNEAASGDAHSNRELATALMDSYDLSGDPEELYEAMVWVDRRWDTSGNAELSQRVVANYCGQRVVRWHWLCLLGE